MSYLSIFIVSFAIALSGALAPGPLLAIVISESTRKGFKTGPLVILGHALLELVMVIVLVFGLGRVINQPVIFKIISFLGSLILVYSGIKIFLSLKNFTLEIQPETGKSSNLIITGFMMSLVNPYWSIWWLTLGLGLLLTAQKAGLIGLSLFFLGHISADFLWYSLVSLTFSRGRRLFSKKVYQTILLGCGLILLGFGLYFFLKIF